MKTALKFILISLTVLFFIGFAVFFGLFAFRYSISRLGKAQQVIAVQDSANAWTVFYKRS